MNKQEFISKARKYITKITSYAGWVAIIVVVGGLARERFPEYATEISTLAGGLTILGKDVLA